jgi:hypothetical protein
VIGGRARRISGGPDKFPGTAQISRAARLRRDAHPGIRRDTGPGRGVPVANQNNTDMNVPA